MVYNIYIIIDRTNNYYSDSNKQWSIKVEKREPYDKLSKRFNRYTHTIQYQQQPYHAKDYNLFLHDPNGWFYKSFFYFYNPKNQIESVDIFFQSNDRSKTYPLIFGFNYQNRSDYYTYYFLKGGGRGIFEGSISKRGLIDNDDLITRLLEEYGLHKTTRKNKFVIRLEKKTTNGSTITYPKTGLHPNKITLTKKTDTGHPGYDVYEHSIDNRNNVEDFFISFQDDTLFMFGGPGKLQKVEVYYNNVQLVIIIFNFKTKKKLYKCSEFITHLPLQNKALSNLEDFSEQNIETILQDEFDKLKRGIELKKNHRQPNQKSPQIKTEKTSSHKPASIQSRHTKSTSPTFGRTDYRSSGHSSRSSDSFGQEPEVEVRPLPPSPPIPSTPQSGNNGRQDTVKGPPPAIPPRAEAGTTSEHSPPGKTDQGEVGKGSEASHNQDVLRPGERGDHDFPRSVESTSSNPHRSDSSSNLKPQSEPHTGDNQKQDDKSDDSISKLKLAGAGVAGTAIGAGAIGGGAHYAHGVLSVIHWLI